MNAPAPLKILILGQDPDLFARPGGAPNDTRARHLGYARELLRRRPGSEVRIVVHTRMPGGATFDVPFTGLEIYGTNSRSRLHAPFDALRIVRRLVASGWEPDVISCQTGYEEGLIAFLARPRGSRIQIQVHSDFYGAGYDGGGLVHRIKRWGIRLAIRHADHARVVSSGIERSIVAAGDMPAERVAVAPVPVVFAADPPRPDPAQPVILFVGRLVPEKDMALWCTTARLIRERFPAARFWIVGEGPERAVVERELAGFGDCARLFGAVNYGDLPALYAKASLFLFTSVFEGLGRVVVEAMMAGLPVISTDIVGPQDLIEDERTGRLVARDPQALAEACRALLENPQSACEMGEAARGWATAHYSFAGVTGRLVDSWEAAAAMPQREK